MRYQEHGFVSFLRCWCPIGWRMYTANWHKEISIGTIIRSCFYAAYTVHAFKSLQLSGVRAQKKYVTMCNSAMRGGWVYGKSVCACVWGEEEEGPAIGEILINVPFLLTRSQSRVVKETSRRCRWEQKILKISKCSRDILYDPLPLLNVRIVSVSYTAVHKRDPQKPHLAISLEFLFAAWCHRAPSAARRSPEQSSTKSSWTFENRIR